LRWVEAVAAVIVVKQGMVLDEAAVLAHCRSEMAHFKCPKRVIFSESLPRNPSGKILKRNLRTLYDSGR
jgi:fatty-acyl-CoA synthase